MGAALGFIEGLADGDDVGLTDVSTTVLDDAGATEGIPVGAAVGLAVGTALGLAVGLAVGTALGLAVGATVGFLVGEGDGFLVGFAVGFNVGTSVITGRLAVSIIKSLKRLKLSVPRPLAGSHPLVALKPCLQQTDSAVQWLSPTVMSFKKVEPYPYKIGWIQPTDLPPARKRAALTSEIIAATTGHDMEVPPPPTKSPPMKKTYMAPAAEMSGYPLPFLLNPG